MATNDLHIQNLYSTTTGNQPQLENLLRGEIALNLADGVIFYRKVTDATQEDTDTIESFSIQGTLDSLKDLAIDSPEEGQALVYDATESKWKNETLTHEHISDFQTSVETIIQEKIESDEVQAQNPNLDELSKLAAEGYVYRKADGTYKEMTVSAVSGEATVANDPEAGTLQVGLADVGTAGTYFKVTTDAKGRVTAGENPTTVDGFGITDAVHKTGDTMSGLLKYDSSIKESTYDENTLVTKKYADSVALGYVFHVSCATGSNTNVEGTYADGEGENKGVGATLTLAADTGNTTTIGGLQLRETMRVLLVGQTDAKQNGCYTVTTLPAESTGHVVLTRADDFDGDPTINYHGATFLITHGDLWGTSWRLMNDGTIEFGTDEINFVQISTPNVYSAGAGISIDANVVAVKQGTTVQVIGDVLEVASGTGNEGKVLMAGADGTAAHYVDLDLSTAVTGTLPIDKGGTGATTAEDAFANLAPAGATNGDVMYFDGTKWTALAKGEGVLVADASGISYQKVLSAGTF